MSRRPRAQGGGSRAGRDGVGVVFGVGQPAYEGKAPMVTSRYWRQDRSARYRPEQLTNPSELLARPPVAVQDYRGWLFAIGEALRAQYEIPTGDLPPRLAALIARLEQRD
jgi:hypothetical protein